MYSNLYKFIQVPREYVDQIQLESEALENEKRMREAKKRNEHMNGYTDRAFEQVFYYCID